MTSRNVDQSTGKWPGALFPILDPREVAVVPKFIYESPFPEGAGLELKDFPTKGIVSRHG